MISELKQPLITLLAAMLFIAGMHVMALEYFLPEDYRSYKLIYGYVFLFMLSFLGFMGIYMVKKHDSSLMPKALLAYTVIKFLATLVFLLPDLLEQTDYTRPYIYQFFAVFFPVLLVESLILLRMANKKEDE